LGADATSRTADGDFGVDATSRTGANSGVNTAISGDDGNAEVEVDDDGCEATDQRQKTPILPSIVPPSSAIPLDEVVRPGFVATKVADYEGMLEGSSYSAASGQQEHGEGRSAVEGHQWGQRGYCSGMTASGVGDEQRATQLATTGIDSSPSCSFSWTTAALQDTMNARLKLSRTVELCGAKTRMIGGTSHFYGDNKGGAAACPKTWIRLHGHARRRMSTTSFGSSV
jgi:hypothetical protein